MATSDFIDWAERQWGQAQLGDKRRNPRAVQLGAALAAQPDASLPTQTGNWAELKAAYRLLAESEVTHEALTLPHRQNTYLQASHREGVVLFIQDTTELDYSSITVRISKPPIWGLSGMVKKGVFLFTAA